MSSLPSKIECQISGDAPLQVDVNAPVTVVGRPEISRVAGIRIEGAARVTFTLEQPQETRLTILMAMLYGVFLGLERISISYYVRGVFAKRVSRWASAQFMDSYIIAWLLIELALYKFAARLLPYCILTFALYRLVELTQAYTNIVIFHRLRHSVAIFGPYRIVSHWRTFVIGVVNLIEGALLYGLLYYSVGQVRPAAVVGVVSSWDALYFSFVTITTLGYGDIQPVGVTRIVACIEAVWGLLFGIALLGRFVAALPADRALDDSGT